MLFRIVSDGPGSTAVLTSANYKSLVQPLVSLAAAYRGVDKSVQRLFITALIRGMRARTGKEEFRSGTSLKDRIDIMITQLDDLEFGMGLGNLLFQELIALEFSQDTFTCSLTGELVPIPVIVCKNREAMNALAGLFKWDISNESEYTFEFDPRQLRAVLPAISLPDTLGRLPVVVVTHDSSNPRVRHELTHAIDPNHSRCDFAIENFLI